MRYFSMDVTVLGGLPLIARYTMARAEPDVGIMSSFVDDIYLEDSNGRRAVWAEKKMTETQMLNLRENVALNHEGEI